MKYINKKTGNIIVPKSPEAEKLLEGSSRYTAVVENKPIIGKAPQKGRK